MPASPSGSIPRQMKDVRIGLKLFSTNTDHIEEAVRLDEGLFQYVELYIIPGTYDTVMNLWKGLPFPYVIHAPHSFQGVNLARSDFRQDNIRFVNEARRFADTLEAETIIVHGGNNGSLEETIRHLALFNDRRLVLENKPKMGLHGELCVGWSPTEFQQVSDAGVLHGTVLDFGHAACAARSADSGVAAFIAALAAFGPRIFHISDGYTDSEKDVHLNLGKGNLELPLFLDFVPEGGLLTLETPREQKSGLRDFVNDVHYVRSLCAD